MRERKREEWERARWWLGRKGTGKRAMGEFNEQGESGRRDWSEMGQLQQGNEPAGSWLVRMRHGGSVSAPGQPTGARGRDQCNATGARRASRREEPWQNTARGMEALGETRERARNTVVPAGTRHACLSLCVSLLPLHPQWVHDHTGNVNSCNDDDDGRFLRTPRCLPGCLQSTRTGCLHLHLRLPLSLISRVPPASHFGSFPQKSILRVASPHVSL